MENKIDDMPADMKKQLKAKARLLDPLVRVGKNGLTENMVQHIKKMLKKRRLVKVKLLRSYIDLQGKKEAVQELADKTGAYVVERVGFNIVLYNYKPKKSG